MEAEIEGAKNMQKVIAVFVILFTLLAGLCAYLLISNSANKQAFIVIEKKSGEDFDERLKKEKDLIIKDLEEKYAADIVSYNAMAKRLDIERKRARELEEKIKK